MHLNCFLIQPQTRIYNWDFCQLLSKIICDTQISCKAPGSTQKQNILFWITYYQLFYKIRNALSFLLAPGPDPRPKYTAAVTADCFIKPLVQSNFMVTTY